MTAEAFRVEFPETPDWDFALRRVNYLSAQQITDAVNQVKSRWGDDDRVEAEDDLGSRHFVMEQLAVFTEGYQRSVEDSKALAFSAISKQAEDGPRGDLYNAAAVLGLLGLLQAAGFEVEDPQAPFAVWPEGEEDPAWWPEQA